MSKLKILGRVNSNNVKKVLWMAEELRIPYDQENIGWTYGGNNTPEYLAKNPTGLVPTIQDGDLTLWESNAIVRYLAAQYADGTHWWPKEAKIRAGGDKWLDWTATVFTPVFGRPIFWPVVRTPTEKQDWKAIEVSIRAAEKVLAMPEEALKKAPFLSGEQIGAGDIALGAFIYAWFEMDFKHVERVDFPALKAWYGRLKEREAYQKAVMIPLS